MPRSPRMPLTASRIGKIHVPGKHALGVFGVSLRVTRSANDEVRRAWVQKIRIDGRWTSLGLGRWPEVSLTEVKRRALRSMRIVAEGGDPRQRAQRERRARTPTVREAVEGVIALHRPGWRSPDSERQWRRSLEMYAGSIMASRVDEVATGELADLVGAIWSEKPETARRVKGRLAAVFTWCVAQGHIAASPAGPDTFAALPKQNGKVKHHAALPHEEVAGLLRRVEASTADDVTRQSFRFLALTGVRSGEARKMRWDEVDRPTSLWTIPGSRTKSGEEHRVPLSLPALAVLDRALALSNETNWVFPSPRPRRGQDRPLSKMAHLQLLRRLSEPCTPHGLRTSIRTWCAETSVEFAVAEAILGHQERSAVVRSYQRSDLLDARRPVMEAWAEYIAPQRFARPSCAPC